MVTLFYIASWDTLLDLIYIFSAFFTYAIFLLLENTFAHFVSPRVSLSCAGDTHSPTKIRFAILTWNLHLVKLICFCSLNPALRISLLQTKHKDPKIVAWRIFKLLNPHNILLYSINAKKTQLSPLEGPAFRLP